MAKGLNIPKGQSVTSKGVRPSFLTKKQAEAFQHEKKLYNERIRRAEKKFSDQFGIGREAVRRTGISGIPVYKRLTDISNKAEYQALMRMMKHSKTKTFKQQRDREVKKTLFDVLDNAYHPCPKRRRWLKRVIDNMTPSQVVEFRLKNKALVHDFFEVYKREMGMDSDAVDDDINKIGEGLAPYSPDGKPMPGC